MKMGSFATGKEPWRCLSRVDNQRGVSAHLMDPRANAAGGQEQCPSRIDYLSARNQSV